MSSSGFENKTALVTGAGTGMGAATARLLAHRGANATLVGESESPLYIVADEIKATGGGAVVVVGDVADPDTMTRAVRATLDAYGTLHHAVNNAGISSENYEIPDLPIEVWDRTIAVNLSSLFYSMRAELPAIEQSGGGVIVNVSSVFADRGLPNARLTQPASTASGG